MIWGKVVRALFNFTSTASQTVVSGVRCVIITEDLGALEKMKILRILKRLFLLRPAAASVVTHGTDGLID